MEDPAAQENTNAREKRWVRVAVVGDAKTGKTNLIQRLTQNTYAARSAPRAPLAPIKFEGPVEEEQSREHHREVTRLYIHDTPASGEVRAGRPRGGGCGRRGAVEGDGSVYLRCVSSHSWLGALQGLWEETDGLLYNVDVIMVVFDAKSKEDEAKSLKAAAKTLDRIKSTPILNEKAVLLVGTKYDCRKGGAEDGAQQEAARKAQAHKLLASYPKIEICVHTSSNTGHHVTTLISVCRRGHVV
jgi:GTPase SAR1 family protein